MAPLAVVYGLINTTLQSTQNHGFVCVCDYGCILVSISLSYISLRMFDSGKQTCDDYHVNISRYVLVTSTKTYCLQS